MKAKKVVLDTEYNPETGAIFWIGLTFDGKTIYGMPWEYQYVDFIKRICADPGITKIGHNILADIRVLGQAGVEVKGDLYDTMLAHYCLYPGLDVGLDHAARFYLGDVRNWKGMEHTDPTYNALDVLYTHDIWQAQIAECAKRPVSPMPEIEARCRLIPVIQQMENDGMRVDVATQRALITKLQGEIEATETTIEERVKSLWAGRVEGAAFDHRVKDEFALQVSGEGKGQCPKHPKSNGLKKPRACPQCWALYDAMAPLRARYKQAQVDKNKAKGKVLKWQEGFNWASSEHLGWLLYEALGLPEQLDRKTRKRTTGAPAIDHLATMIEGARRDGKVKSKYHVSDDKWEIVRDIKETQGKAKAISTFLELPLTDDGYLKWPHLSYKINGTETGRLAGGEDKGGDTDKLRAEGHSLMNIPQEWRRIYVPPPHHIFIAMDYCLAKGTLIDTPYGHKPIESLKKGDLVYAADPKTGLPCCERVTELKKHADRGNLRRVVFDDGTAVVCTSDHPWIGRDGTEISTSCLREGTSLLAIRRTMHPRGYVHMYTRTAFEYTKEHVAVARMFRSAAQLKGKHVHHMNDNKGDNRPENLSVLTPAEHTSLHTLGRARPEHGDVIRAAWKRGAYKNKRDDGVNNPNWRGGPKPRWCEYCGKEFAVVKNCRPERFCGTTCYHNWRRKSDSYSLNHRVVSVEHVNYLEDVYDLSVTGCHTFALWNGVISHNCNQEGRLAAYISNDLSYIEAFIQEDASGVDVHSQMAALIFNIDPSDARKVKVMYKGVEKKARDVGKAANHASSYALNPVSALYFNFGMPLADAVRVNNLLYQTRPTLMKVKQQMVKDILGEYVIDVGRTGKARAALITPGRRFQATPWGWQMVWNGVGKVVKDPVTGKDVAVPEQANEVLAFGLGQAPGASIWARVTRQVYDHGIKIAVGNYDNLVVAVPRTPIGVREGRETLVKLMCQPWAEIGGRGLPVEGKIGMNWGDASDDNPEGLRGWDDDN